MAFISKLDMNYRYIKQVTQNTGYIVKSRT